MIITILITTNDFETIIINWTAPSPPENFRLVDERNLTFSWDKPSYVPGKLQQYLIYFRWEPFFPSHPDCHPGHRQRVDKIDPADTNYTWPNWVGYANYWVQMKAETNGRSNYSNYVNFTVKAFRRNFSTYYLIWSKLIVMQIWLEHFVAAPDGVKNLKYETKVSNNDSDRLETILSWNLPCSLQGDLKQFQVSVNGSRQGFDSHYFNKTIDVKTEFEGNTTFSINLGELRAEYSYTYEVFAITVSKHGEKFNGAVATVNEVYPAGSKNISCWSNYWNSIKKMRGFSFYCFVGLL